MPQFLLLAAAGAAVVAGYKLLRREMDRVGATLAEARAVREPVEAGRLVRGDDGVYRPDHRRD